MSKISNLVRFKYLTPMIVDEGMFKVAGAVEGFSLHKDGLDKRLVILQYLIKHVLLVYPVL
jgi:hypothetical protein